MAVNQKKQNSQLYEETNLFQHYESMVVGEEEDSKKYECYTLDKNGNETIDEISEEDTLQMIKEISTHYGDHAIVEFSDDGKAAWIGKEEGKGEEELFDEQIVIHKADVFSFQDEMKPYRIVDELPAYSGIFDIDKAIVTALEDCSEVERGFVYTIIRQNFLIKYRQGLTEEERQANISLGMKKAEYAAKHMISDKNRDFFLKKMEFIAKLASAGSADSDGKMDYGVKKGSYLGHGKNLIDTANPVDMMRRMDIDAYEEYQKICTESSKEDKLISALKYLSNWYSNQVLKNPSMLEQYKKQSEEYVEKYVRNRELDTSFATVAIESKEVFLEGLKKIQLERPGFLSSVLCRELEFGFREI